MGKKTALSGTLTTKKKPLEPVESADKEGGFSLSGLQAAKVPEYSALHDRNLRAFFESKQVRQQLHDACLVDRNGRILDVDHNMGKLHIIEQEFTSAEIAELRRQKENELQRQKLEQRKKAAADQLSKQAKIGSLRPYSKPAAAPTRQASLPPLIDTQPSKSSLGGSKSTRSAPTGTSSSSASSSTSSSSTHTPTSGKKEESNANDPDAGQDDSYGSDDYEDDNEDDESGSDADN